MGGGVRSNVPPEDLVVTEEESVEDSRTKTSRGKDRSSTRTPSVLDTE